MWKTMGRDMDWKPIISFSVQLTFITVKSYIGLDHTNSPIKKGARDHHSSHIQTNTPKLKYESKKQTRFLVTYSNLK